MKPNDFKNATLDAVSSFPDVIFPVKGVSLVCFGCSFNRNTLIPLYMQPNCDFFSAKIKQSTVTHVPVVTIRIRGHVALDTYDIHVDIYRHCLIHATVAAPAIRRKS